MWAFVRMRLVILYISHWLFLMTTAVCTAQALLLSLNPCARVSIRSSPPWLHTSLAFKAFSQLILPTLNLSNLFFSLVSSPARQICLSTCTYGLLISVLALCQ